VCATARANAQNAQSRKLRLLGSTLTWRAVSGLHRPNQAEQLAIAFSNSQRVLELLDQAPPKGYSQWNGARLTEALPGISKAQVWRILRRHDICLQRRRSWCISTDPEFGPKAADVVGLYLNPPENALVLAVDEKPSIQALERAQGYLRLPDGKAVNGFGHCYTRHGTTTLFAALEVTTGLVKTAHYQRRRRREFLDFMNEIVSANPGRKIHVVLDNLNTHKPKEDRWLKRHSQVHFHFIPTYSSWLNQVECWFSIFTRQALRGASFTSPHQLRQAIDDFVAAYNQKAAPFEWKKAVVFSSGPVRKYSNPKFFFKTHQVPIYWGFERCPHAYVEGLDPD
jgi:DDE superfamily endonuclease